MVRARKDESIRRQEFIQSARQLFFTNGYHGTTINDILAGVEDSSASPGVFYYYFESKEDIYQQVMEQYIEECLKELEATIHDEYVDIEGKLMRLVLFFVISMEDSNNVIDRSEAITDHLFVLDLQNRLKRRMIRLWEMGLAQIEWIEEEHVKFLARFVTGGIGEVIYDFVFAEEPVDKDIQSLTRHIIQYTMQSLNAPEGVKQTFERRLQDDGRRGWE